MPWAEYGDSDDTRLETKDDGIGSDRGSIQGSLAYIYPAE